MVSSGVLIAQVKLYIMISSDDETQQSAEKYMTFMAVWAVEGAVRVWC